MSNETTSHHTEQSASPAAKFVVYSTCFDGFDSRLGEYKTLKGAMARIARSSTPTSCHYVLCGREYVYRCPRLVARFVGADGESSTMPACQTAKAQASA